MSPENSPLHPPEPACDADEVDPPEEARPEVVPDAAEPAPPEADAGPEPVDSTSDTDSGAAPPDEPGGSGRPAPPELSRIDAGLAAVFAVRSWPVPVRRWAIALFVVAAVVGFVASLPSSGEQDDRAGAEELVRDYLTALADGDVGGALDLIDKSDRFGKDPFLNVAAAGGGFEVVAVALETDEYPEPRTMHMNASVRVVVAADGVRQDGRFELEQSSEGDWKITNPLAEVNFSESPLWDIELNGVPVPYDESTDTNLDDQRFALLPGVYHWDNPVPDLAAVDSSPVIVLPGNPLDPYAGTSAVPEPEITLTEAGEAAVQTAVNDYIDECAELPEMAVAGCPFGADYIPDPRDDDYVLDQVSGISWTVDEYPVVAAAVQDGVISLVDRELGDITVTGTGVEDEEHPDDPVTGELACPIETSRLAAGVEPDGTVRIYPAGYRFGFDDMDQDPIGWKTC